jgi:hypothetical protein
MPSHQVSVRLTDCIIRWVKTSAKNDYFMEIIQPGLGGATLHQYFNNKQYSYIIPLARGVGDEAFLSDLRQNLSDVARSEDDSKSEDGLKCGICSGVFPREIYSKHVKLCGVKVSHIRSH